LISLKYWWNTGILNTIHPSGLILFITICILGFLLKKSFCSWLCPIGTLSEGLWGMGQKLFGRNLKIPRFLDYPLRGLKYMLLAFFVYAILMMDVDALRRFIYSPYNKVADIKMYYFFAAITPFAFSVIAILVVLSVIVKNFWCRYLCPYGALLGLGSLLSPIKIKRDAQRCIDCELCTKACPASIQVHTIHTVWSDECTSCLKCVQVCPVQNTLEMRMHRTGTRISARVFGALIVGVFIGITGLAMMTGHWHNSISTANAGTR
jgi:polyferredoxin